MIGTGNWCFYDGLISFGDIKLLYSRYLRGRVLTIIADCSHSGAWVNTCVSYLAQRGVKPCGHSAKEMGILIKIFASCEPPEKAASTCFFVRAAANRKRKGLHIHFPIELTKTQHSYGVSSTKVTCKKNIDEACVLNPNYTWGKWWENNSGKDIIQRGIGREHSNTEV